MATINKGTLVQILGASSSKPTVKPWSPAAFEQPTLSSAHITLGVAMTDSDPGQPVATMKRGYLRDLSDGAETWSVGEILYAGAAGAPTHTRPTAPYPIVIIGTVFAANGSNWDVDVDVRVVPSLGELSGVSVETPADKDVFIYKSSTNVWEPRMLDHGADLTAASLLDNDHPLYQRKHGFEVASDGSALVTITYDKTTRKITVTPVGATFRFWIDGVQYIKSGAQLSGAHTTDLGKHFFYYDSSGTLQVSTTPWSIRDRTATPVALVYWESTSSDGWCFYECHTADRTLEQHYHDHYSEGTKYITGGALSGYTLTTDTDAAVSFAIAAATIADEDIVRVLTAVADGGPYMTLWRSGAAGNWTFNDTRTSPYEVVAPYIAYNNQNAGGAGVWGLSSVGSGNFVPYFLCATTSVQTARQFFMVPAQAVTGTLASALAYTTANIDWGTVPFEEFVPLYRIIFRTGASYASTGRARIEQIDSVSTSSTATLPGTPTLHNALGGRDVINTHPASSITFTPYSTLAATDVQSAIEELLDESGGGGATVLDDLTDVNAPTPSDGDVLAWDSGASEWVNTPAGTPGAHAATHENGGGDEVLTENLATAETDQVLVLKPDGAGGVEWDVVTTTSIGTSETDTSKVLKPDGSGGVEWGTGGGGGGIADEGQPDEVPSSPTAYDDEFTGASLDAKWSVVGGSSSAAQIYGAAPATSWFRLKFTGNNFYNIKQSISKAAGVAFSMTGKLSFPFYSQYNTGGIYAYSASENDLFGMSVDAYTVAGVFGGMVRGAHSRVDGGSANYGFATGAPIAADSSMYVHLQRDASNNWQGFISSDGVNWIPCAAAYGKSFDVDHIALSLYVNATIATGGLLYAGWDWFRVDYQTL